MQRDEVQRGLPHLVLRAAARGGLRLGLCGGVQGGRKGSQWGLFGGEPLVQRYLSNAGFLQKWRRMLQITVILDTTKQA